MKLIDRRRFLVTATAAIAACDRIVVEVEGRPSIVQIDEDGKPFISPISTNEEFYRYQVGTVPELNPNTWDLAIIDRGTELGRIDADALSRLEVREVELTLQCIGSGPNVRNINNAIWGGLPLVEVLEAQGLARPGGSIVEFRLMGADEYDASLPVADLEDAPVWLIWEMNGEPLPIAHGAPARLMVPGRYGIKNLKWITEIEYLDVAYQGFWDAFGWDHNGPYLTNGFIFVPTTNAEVQGPVWVIGTAFAGKDPIELIELTDDGGETWMACDIGYGGEANIWALWEVLWDPSPGAYDIQVRVTAVSGAQSVMEPSGTDRYKGYDGGMLISLTVV
jgi:DMSO/TMAO reductase YedYZ molybdopterin-dependent catalytic subunit